MAMAVFKESLVNKSMMNYWQRSELTSLSHGFLILLIKRWYLFYFIFVINLSTNCVYVKISTFVFPSCL